MTILKRQRPNRILLVLWFAAIYMRRRCYSNESKHIFLFSLNDIMGLFTWSKKAEHIPNYFPLLDHILWFGFSEVFSFFSYWPKTMIMMMMMFFANMQKYSSFLGFILFFLLFFGYSYSFIHLYTILSFIIMNEVSSFKFYGGSSGNKFSFILSDRFFFLISSTNNT